MFEPNTFGIFILLAGSMMLLLAVFGAPLLARIRNPLPNSTSFSLSSLTHTSDAILIAQQGKIVDANEYAKKLFGSGEDTPNLNRIARMAQPQDAFFYLFASEGQTTLTVSDRSVDATSVRTPGNMFVVTLRENTQLEKLRGNENSEQVINAINEISRTLFTSLDLNIVTNNILQTIGRIIRYDLAEITLWDSQSQVLRPYARAGDRTYTIILNQKVTSYGLNDGYTGWIARNKETLLVGNTERRLDVQPQLKSGDFPARSIVGIPLLYGPERELIGTLELASFELDTYKIQDTQLLELIAGQAVIAIRNAQIYVEQQTRLAELSGLAEVAQTASSLANTHELYASLTSRIANLIGAQLCGILLYNENEHALISQPPFHGGVPEAFLKMYRIPLPANSIAAKMWAENDFWYTNDVQNNPLVAEAGLIHLAETVGVKTTLLAPLNVAGKRLGVVQVSNKLSNAPFDDSDARLLKIYAGQTAILIDNARLVKESEERAKRSEEIRLIAEITGSSRPLSDIYRDVIARIANLLSIDFSILLLLNEAKGELVPQPGSEYGSDWTTAEFSRMSADDPAFKFSVTALRRPFYTWKAGRDRRVTLIYKRLVEHFQIESAIIVPLIIQDRSIGELAIASKRTRAFARADIELLATIAAQLASAIERNRLALDTDDSLRRRVEQLTAITRVGRELNQTLDLDHILKNVHSEAIQTTEANCGSIVLLDTSSSTPTARIRIGCQPYQAPEKLDVFETDVALSGASHIISDIDSDEALNKLGLSNTGIEEIEAITTHGGIRSLMVVPVVYQGITVGVIELHHERINAFNNAMLDFLQTLAAQTAIAVGNAQRYEEQIQHGDLLRRRADQLSQLLQISRTVRSDRPLEQNLEAIAFGIQEAVGFNLILISVLDSETNTLRRMAAAGIPVKIFEQMKNETVPWAIYAANFKAEFRISQSYYIPHDRIPEELRRSGVTIDTAHSTTWKGAGYWHPNDYLLVPLYGSGGQFVGTMSVDDPHDGKAPDRATVETIEIFANQSALAIENARLYQSAESQAKQLSQSLADLQKSYRDLGAVSRTLERKDQELGALINQTDLRAKRLLSLHHIASAAAELREEHSMLQRVAEATVSEMDTDICLIGITDRNTLRIIANKGAADETNRIASLLTTLNPMSQVVELRTPVFDPECGPHGWGATQLIKNLNIRSFISVPITIARNIGGAVLIGSRKETSPFSNEDIDLFTLLGNQIGINIENIRLYEDQTTIADENARLYGETRELQEFSESVFESLQQGVIVLDTQNRVLSINGWMRQTFGWTNTLIGKNLFEFRSIYRELGLADAVARAISNGQPIDRLAIHDTNPQGMQLSTNFYGYPLRREGQVSGVVLLIEDVTTQARLEADIRERATQLQYLAESARVISSALRREDVIALTLEQIGRVIPYDTATLWLRDDTLLRVAGARGFENSQEQIGLVVQVEDSLLFKELTATGQPIVVADVRHDERFPAGIISRTRSWLGTPLISKGQSLGLLAIDKVEAGFYSNDHAELAIAFATQAAIALDNARLFEESFRRAFELDERSQRLALLNRISSSLSTSLDVHRILEIASREMSSAMGSASIIAIMHDDNEDIGRITFSYPMLVKLSDIPPMPLSGNLLVERVRETNAPVIIDDIAKNELLLPSTMELLNSAHIHSLLVMPLTASARLLGMMIIDQGEQGHFSSGEIELAQTIANQTAISIENSHLYTEARQRTAELGALFELGVSMTQELDAERLMTYLFEKVQLLLNVNSITVVVAINSEWMRIESLERGKRLEQVSILRKGDTFTEHVLNSGQPLMIGDIERDKPSLAVPGKKTGQGTRSWLGVPLTVGGKTIGVMAIYNDQPDYFDQSALQLLSQIGNQVAISLENARLFAETQSHAAELEQHVAERTRDLQHERDRVETLLRITSELSASLDLDRVLGRALSLVNDTIGGTQGGLFLLDTQSDQIIYRAALGSKFQMPLGGVAAPFKRGEGLVGWVIKNRQEVVINDLTKDSRWIQRPLSEQHRSAICAPLISSDDALGAMIFYSDQVNAFDDDQLRLVSAAASQVTSAINNAELYRLIRDQAERLGGMLRANQVEASKSQSILESVADGVLVADPSGTIILFNATAERILNIDRQEILGHPINDFMGIYGNTATKLLDAIRRWSDDPTSYKSGDLLAERIELEDKRVISVLLTPVTSSDEFLGSVSIFRDITREVEVDRLKTEFVTTVSHELRTPITPIKGYVDMLLMGAAGPLTPIQHQLIETIKNNADRLRILVDDLLDISKIESDTIKINTSPVNIAEVVDDVISHLDDRVNNQKREMNFVNTVKNDLPLVQADRRRLTQILSNLGDNAFNYTEPGGTITFDAYLEDGSLVVSVADTGIGLSPEDKVRMFERFYRAENSLVMASAGTGLGLSIVQRLVDMHGGKLWAESDGIGCGSTFYVKLQLATTGIAT